MSDRREILPGFTVDRDEAVSVVCIPSGDAYMLRVDFKDGSSRATGCETEEEGWKAIHRLAEPVVPQTEG